MLRAPAALYPRFPTPYLGCSAVFRHRNLGTVTVPCSPVFRFETVIIAVSAESRAGGARMPARSVCLVSSDIVPIRSWTWTLRPSLHSLSSAAVVPSSVHASHLHARVWRALCTCRLPFPRLTGSLAWRALHNSIMDTRVPRWRSRMTHQLVCWVAVVAAGPLTK